MIDRINIHNGIHVIANEIFIYEDINESDIMIFSNNIKKFVENEFDSYVLKNEEDLLDFIPERNKGAFKDYTTGYVRKMQIWIDCNPVEIERKDIPVKEIINNMPNNTGLKKALVIGGISTIVAIGISIFTSGWFIIFAEFLVLIIAYYIYIKEKNKEEAKKIPRMVQ